MSRQRPGRLRSFPSYVRHLRAEIGDHAPFSTSADVSHMTEDDILGFVPDDSGETEITLTVSNGEDEVEDSVTVHVK